MKSSLLANTNEKKSENNLPLLLSVILFSDQLSHYISKIRKVNEKNTKCSFEIIKPTILAKFSKTSKKN